MTTSEFLLEMTLKSTGVLLAATISTRLMTRSSAAARHLVWSAAFLCLLVLPAAVAFTPTWRIASLPERLMINQHEGASVRSLNQSNSIAPVTAAAPQVSGEPSPKTPNSLTLSAIRLSSLLVNLWFAGVLLIALKLTSGLLSAARISRRATRIVDSDWAASLAEAAGALGIRRTVPILKSDRTIVASTCGVFRPRILLPPDASHWNGQRRHFVLLHELAHVKRHDCLVQALARLAWALYWFNPLAHFAITRMSAEQERACDDVVLAGGSRGPDYASELLEMARALRPNTFPEWSTLSIARRSQFEERLTAILDPARTRHSPSRGIYALAVVLVGLASVPIGAAGLSAARVGPPTIIKGSSVPQRNIIPKAETANMVWVNVSVSDPNGRLVSSLQAEDFQVWEDKVEQTVQSFEENSPLTIGLITGNLSDKLAAGLTSLLKMGDESQYFLIQMKRPQQASLEEDITNDVSRLQNHIEATPNGSALPSLDSVYLGLEKIRGVSGRKALLLITDRENDSRYSPEQIKDFAKREGVNIFAIGIGIPSTGRPVIEGLVEDPGRAHFPDSIDEVPDLLTRMGVSFKTQYRIGYQSTNATLDGNWRQIRVKVNAHLGMRVTVRAKSGYFAAKAPGDQARSQSIASPLAFEVASIKPDPSGRTAFFSCRGTDSPASSNVPIGRCVGENTNLRMIIAAAYDIPFSAKKSLDLTSRK